MDIDKNPIDVSGFADEVSVIVKDFAQDLIGKFPVQIESLTMTGSCITSDYTHGRSDINSVVILDDVSMSVLDGIASLGKRFGKRHVRAPLIMTREYILRSLDVFPVEFLDIKLIHKTVYGQDMFSPIELDKSMLRLQCERDLKARLINLRQGYIACSGDTRALNTLLTDVYSGYFPLLRAMLHIVGDSAPLPTIKDDVLADIEKTFAMSMESLMEIRSIRGKKRPLFSNDQAHRIFNEVYRITHEFSLKMDKIFS